MATRATKTESAEAGDERNIKKDKLAQPRCICTSCGYEFVNTAGTMCSAQKCPVCGGSMRRK